MTDAELTRLEEQLIHHEGVRLKPYLCTAHRWTIGCGFNFQDRGLAELSRRLGRTVTVAQLERDGITRTEAEKVLRADVLHFDAAIAREWPTYRRLNVIRRGVVLDLVFNLGGAGAAKFKRAMAAIELGCSQTDMAIEDVCFAAAAYHMADSLWARQVDDGLGGRFGRADRLCQMMATGKASTK